MGTHARENANIQKIMQWQIVNVGPLTAFKVLG